MVGGSSLPVDARESQQDEITAVAIFEYWFDFEKLVLRKMEGQCLLLLYTLRYFRWLLAATMQLNDESFH